MGYYTYYTMEARNIKTKERYDELIDEMVKMELYSTEDSSGVFDTSNYDEIYHSAGFDSYDEAKWYDHTYDMVRLSKLFPEITFQLHGEGEEKEDLWNKYFRNGACEECYAQIIYPRPVEIDWDD